jgi:hypothetical protein
MFSSQLLSTVTLFKAALNTCVFWTAKWIYHLVDLGKLTAFSAITQPSYKQTLKVLNHYKYYSGAHFVINTFSFHLYVT